METWIVVGAAVVAVAPRVPGLRHAAKAAVRGGMRAVDVGRDAATTAGEHWADLVAEAKSEGTTPNGSSSTTNEVTVPVTSEEQPASS